MEVRLAPVTTATEADLPAVAGLLSDVFGPDRNWEEELAWQYIKNPSGKAIYINGYDEDDGLVAHYAVIPTNPLADPAYSSISTYLSLNTAVHPRAQGKGLFKKTAQAVYSHLAELGDHLVLGVANENSVHGFISSLGFYLLGQLKVEAYLPGTSPKSQVPRLLCPTPEAVRWRFTKPGAGYQRSRRHQVLCTRSFKGIPVHCILSAGGVNPEASSITRDLMPRRPRYCPAIYATYGPPAGFAWLVPETLRPSPFHLICRPSIQGSPLQLLNHIQNRRFEFFDFDVV